MLETVSQFIHSKCWNTSPRLNQHLSLSEQKMDYYELCRCSIYCSVLHWIALDAMVLCLHSGFFSFTWEILKLNMVHYSYLWSVLKEYIMNMLGVYRTIRLKSDSLCIQTFSESSVLCNDLPAKTLGPPARLISHLYNILFCNHTKTEWQQSAELSCGTFG